MSLADFIDENMDAVLGEWEQFARTLPPAAHMNAEALRDEARQILSAMARDMRKPQSDAQQEAKSKGRQPRTEGGRDTAAESHAGGRFEEGFDLNQMVAEYRALRASVIRLWTRQMRQADRSDLDELVRFNEAVDQALTESITRFSAKIERSRELFLGVLGHDLRTPLGAVLNSARYLIDSQSLPAQQIKAASRILSSAARIQKMISDLLDVASTRLGGRLPVAREGMDIGEAASRVIGEAEAFHPDCTVRLETRGDLNGTWDEQRIYQMLSNLVENAVKHGAKDAPVLVSLEGEETRVVLAVHNQGAPIPEREFRRIFEPLARLEDGWRRTEGRGSLGLGLYIAREIARAHGGSIDVASSAEAGTTFTVCLPRSP